MIKKFPKWDGGLGDVFMAAFYALAPWPLSDLDMALKHMKKAYIIEPNSKRNTYYMGVMLYRQKKFNEAAIYFKSAETKKCLSQTERDICNFLILQSQKALKLSLAKA